MGHSRRRKPKKLAGKLLEIRKDLELTQDQISLKLSDKNIKLYKGDISNFESGQREPDLLVLLKYARLGKVTVDFLADDDTE
jgi:transcriptional regulator with XRE-family HTH domain